MKTKKYVLWILAAVITLASVFYQRKTGPTYPKRIKQQIENIEYSFKLPRSFGGTADCPIEIEISDKTISGQIFYKKYPSNDEWLSSSLARENNFLKTSLPNQPPAGKLEYYIVLNKGSNSYEISKSNPLKIRFKGEVPAWALIPHVLFMFIAMFLSNVAGLFAFARFDKYKFYTTLTFIALLIGGMILGPVVQKFAFNEFWTGVPFGWDLTDNKTLIGFVFWTIAIAANYKKDKPYLVIVAAIMLLLIYCIPHSMFGSELDHATGQVGQG
ncbi:MAG: hypothetical protein HN704_01935 [Bacteroidetes bacterium]|jgi:hypothetical protein|nr:hypothetical protein [Bacteroidota bacterium]MBT6688093.1 hypothetical protein [Bacteroidota bacterium]MBT7144526.1 hypothetical protein [Bacteroidota bacterium]MBT7490345.1 hypothetical protein [Bacteroidota bacterium]